MSLKCTVSAETRKHSPMVKMYCAIRLTGRNSTQGVRALPKMRKKATSTGRPRRKWTMLVVTTMIGSTSIGNLIFLISAPCTDQHVGRLEQRGGEPGPGQDAVEQEQGVELGAGEAGHAAAADDEAEDHRVDQHQQQRVEQAPEEAEHGAAVARLQLPRDQGEDQLAVAEDFLQFFDHVVSECALYRKTARRRSVFRIYFRPLAGFDKKTWLIEN